jgi:glycerol uptake facilitator-like aquaporin
MAQIAVAFAVGIIFALGLAVSEMINPARVIGFRACGNGANLSGDSEPVKTNSCCAI